MVTLIPPCTPVTFTPLSARERQLLKEHGPAWETVQTRERVPCLRGEPGALLTPAGSNDYRRWIPLAQVQVTLSS